MFQLPETNLRDKVHGKTQVTQNMRDSFEAETSKSHLMYSPAGAPYVCYQSIKFCFVIIVFCYL